MMNKQKIGAKLKQRAFGEIKCELKGIIIKNLIVKNYE